MIFQVPSHEHPWALDSRLYWVLSLHTTWALDSMLCWVLSHEHTWAPDSQAMSGAELHIYMGSGFPGNVSC